MERLKDLRLKIDDIDDKIVKLLEERLNVAKEIGKIKKDEKKAILDENREKVVLDKVKKGLSNKEYETIIEDIYKNIMSNSKKIQK